MKNLEFEFQALHAYRGGALHELGLATTHLEKIKK